MVYIVLRIRHSCCNSLAGHLRCRGTTPLTDSLGQSVEVDRVDKAARTEPLDSAADSIAGMLPVEGYHLFEQGDSPVLASEMPELEMHAARMEWLHVDVPTPASLPSIELRAHALPVGWFSPYPGVKL